LLDVARLVLPMTRQASSGPPPGVRAMSDDLDEESGRRPRDRRAETAKAAARTGILGHAYARTTKTKQRLIFAPGLEALRQHQELSKAAFDRHLRWLVENERWVWTKDRRTIILPQPGSRFAILPLSLLSAAFGSPIRPSDLATQAWNSAQVGVDLHAANPPSLQVAVSLGRNAYPVTEGDTYPAGVRGDVEASVVDENRHESRSKEKQPRVLPQTLTTPLTDDEVRELGFEPTKQGWVPL
jgi:hypothetical protein